MYAHMTHLNFDYFNCSIGLQLECLVVVWKACFRKQWHSCSLDLLLLSCPLGLFPFPFPFYSLPPILPCVHGQSLFLYSLPLSAFLCFYYPLNSPPHTLNKLYSLLYCLQRHPLPPYLTTLPQNITHSSLSSYKHIRHDSKVESEWIKCLPCEYDDHS